MPLPIFTYRDMYLVRSSAEYDLAQSVAIGKLRSRGRTISIHQLDVPIIAYFNHNRWLVDCACGSGAGIDLDRDTPIVARCFECGSVHTNVIMPAWRRVIESALLQRPRLEKRNWLPGESVEDLRAENAAHGVDG